jgi:hypothetical protein
MKIRMPIIAAAFAAFGVALSAQQFPIPTYTSAVPVDNSARLMSMGSAGVALPGDLSTLQANPAALAFMPKREFEASIDWIGESADAAIFGRSFNSELSRLRFARFGLLNAVPVARGGLAFAFAFHRPYAFCDLDSYQALYFDNQNQYIRTENDYRDYGDLSYWSGGCGIQVAQGLGIGIAASLITGAEHERLTFFKTVDDSIIDPMWDDFDRSTSRNYLGYDVRAGIGYAPIDRLYIGARVVFPQSIWFAENVEEQYPHSQEPDYAANPDGKLISSFSAATGASLRLRFMTIAAEIHGRAPYSMVYLDQRFPAESPAAYAKGGGAAGIEVPLPTKTLLRAGYGIDQPDMYAFARLYDGADADWGLGGLAYKGYRQQFTFGVCQMVNAFCIEAAYGCQIFRLTKNETLASDHAIQRIVVSAALQY